MLKTLAEEEKMETEFLVSVITFGSEVRLHLPYTQASYVSWQRLTAGGSTPMGTALRMAKAMIEDKNVTPSRAYRPMVILVSDGQPNDNNWEKFLEDFIGAGRSSKCYCMAMAIGSDADEDVLARFISKTPYLQGKVPNRVFHAKNAEEIHEFFEKVTMTATVTTLGGGTRTPLDPPPGDYMGGGDTIRPGRTESFSDEKTRFVSANPQDEKEEKEEKEFDW
jgi:uncharacterized protein YegL